MYRLQGGACLHIHAPELVLLYHKHEASRGGLHSPIPSKSGHCWCSEVHQRTKRAHGLQSMRTLRGREADIVSSLQALKDECIHT